MKIISHPLIIVEGFFTRKKKEPIWEIFAKYIKIALKR